MYFFLVYLSKVYSWALPHCRPLLCSLYATGCNKEWRIFPICATVTPKTIYRNVPFQPLDSRSIQVVYMKCCSTNNGFLNRMRGGKFISVMKVVCHIFWFCRFIKCIQLYVMRMSYLSVLYIYKIYTPICYVVVYSDLKPVIRVYVQIVSFHSTSRYISVTRNSTIHYCQWNTQELVVGARIVHFKKWTSMKYWYLYQI